MLSRDDRISWKEAEQVVRLHRLRRDYPIDVPVSELAEAMDIDVSELNGLLADSRQSGRPRRRFIDRSGLVSAGIAAVAAVLLLVAFISIHASRSAASPVVASQDDVTVTEPSGQVIVAESAEVDSGATKPAVEPQPAPMVPIPPTDTVTVEQVPSNG